jgi:hypothetical protein
MPAHVTPAASRPSAAGTDLSSPWTGPFLQWPHHEPGPQPAMQPGERPRQPASTRWRHGRTPTCLANFPLLAGPTSGWVQNWLARPPSPSRPAGASGSGWHRGRQDEWRPGRGACVPRVRREQRTIRAHVTSPSRIPSSCRRPGPRSNRARHGHETKGSS